MPHSILALALILLAALSVWFIHCRVERRPRRLRLVVGPARDEPISFPLPGALTPREARRLVGER